MCKLCKNIETPKLSEAQKCWVVGKNRQRGDLKPNGDFTLGCHKHYKDEGCAHRTLTCFCWNRTAVDGKESPIFEEGPSRRKIFCLMEQSVILRRENIALIVAERNLLSSVGRNLALALLSSRTLGMLLARSLLLSQPPSFLGTVPASELWDNQDFIHSARWAHATTISACNGAPARSQRSAMPVLLCPHFWVPESLPVHWLSHVCVPGTPGEAEFIPSVQLLAPLLPGFTCSLSNLLLLASCFRPRDLTPSKFGKFWESQFWEMGRASKELNLQGRWVGGECSLSEPTATSRECCSSWYQYLQSAFPPNSQIITACTGL